MAFLAARCSGSVQAVSERHAEVSRQIFAPLFPRRPLGEVPIGHVTNGVHMASWDSPGADALWAQYCGAERWRGDVTDHACRMTGIPDEALWAMRLAARQRLVEFARSRLVRQLEQRANQLDVSAAASALDPNALTLGFARRFTEYKRPNLLLRQPERLVRLLSDPQRPVQIIVAGKAHPEDEPGQRFIRDWFELARDPRLRRKIVFLEDYDLAVAAQMVQGIDVWINTPRAPWEACGTSGMKVLVNGGLNLSILDGWWAEAFDPEVGWGIAPRSDDEDAERLLETLEQEVVPLFFAQDPDGISRGWVARVRASLARLTPQFSTNRMLAEYVERLYQPAAAAFAERLADGGAQARALADWSERLQREWSSVRLGNGSWQQDAAGRSFAVEVHLGELTPADVEVQLYAEAGIAGDAPYVENLRLVRALPGAIHVFRYEIDGIVGGHPSDFTPRVIPRAPRGLLSTEARLIRWP
jgi:starch phosphorylase